MKQADAIKVLASLHDRALLVPFIGAGMSIGPCVSWDKLIGNLETIAGVSAPASATNDKPARADAVMQILRRGTFMIPDAIRQAVYVPARRADRTHSDALARMRWPLICSTNYDDVYLRAALNHSTEARRQAVPRVLGRGEHDCRAVLQQLGMPTGELLWCLQGFLTPDAFSVSVDSKGETLALQECLGAGADLSSEIVLSHSEYRSVTHRMPHFRRSFAEVFRSRAFLFLGAGLTEPYFRSLFDEVIELVGPSAQPHFALVPKGVLDSAFMLAHYHTILIEYEKDRDGEHSKVGQFVSRLADTIESQRAHPQAWGWRVPVPENDGAARDPVASMAPDFTIVQAPLPLDRRRLRKGDLLGISCGRTFRKSGADVPTPGSVTRSKLQRELSQVVTWRSDYLVSWAGSEGWVRGIVARDPLIANSRDARSPSAVYAAFLEFLDDAQRSSTEVAFVQLLSSGSQKTFESWVSLVQMARAYGRWVKKRRAKDGSPMKVNVHLHGKDEVVALMKGGYLDISEHLSDAPMRLIIELIDAHGRAQRQYAMVDADSKVKSLAPFKKSKSAPAFHVLPVPGRKVRPLPFSEIANETLMDLGLVSGGTLVADYRPDSIEAARDAAEAERLAMQSARDRA